MFAGGFIVKGDDIDPGPEGLRSAVILDEARLEREIFAHLVLHEVERRLRGVLTSQEGPGIPTDDLATLVASDFFIGAVDVGRVRPSVEDC